jgi:hypothetical protein
MGYFPSGNAALSHLLHGGPTGRLNQRLVASAASATQLAYSLGWLTHVLADALVHPLVNRAAALSGIADLRLAHIRVEVGLDVSIARGMSGLRQLRVRNALESADMTFLRRSLADVLGFDIGDAELLQMHRGITRFVKPCLAFATTLAPDLCWGERPAQREASVLHDVAWRMVHYHVRSGLEDLPDYDLESGEVAERALVA